MASVPAHQQIRDELIAEIESGALGPGARLPGEIALAKRFGVTRMTLRQALAAMVNDGMLVRRQGVGTFVAQDAARRRNMTRLTGFREDMRNEGRPVETRMLAQEIRPATAEVATPLGLEEGAHVTLVERLRLVGGEPVVIQRSWIPYERCPELWREPLVEGSLYATLQTRWAVELRRADQSFSAVEASSEQAALLDVAPGAPLLQVERLTLDDANVPVEVAQSWMRPGFGITTHIER
ncbi:GntR family transcriptional regulator [Conexibacter arvalis]|uniref:GntR family transcriptional regulator n=1 Tax=Conexibacter arvalis TaxID=912552 RepID=A0A840IGC7_9ACTN|nr:GntR family transcriptional regulator [Conexibacter arvalis]MBB4663846.1 GntR family transcriptional regulator [Conexibacter arvalis]